MLVSVTLFVHCRLQFPFFFSFFCEVRDLVLPNKKQNKEKVLLWAKHLVTSCIASLLRLQRSKESWCLVQGSCKKVLKLFHFFFFSYAKGIFQLFWFFFFSQWVTNLLSWVSHKINELSMSTSSYDIFFSIKIFKRWPKWCTNGYICFVSNFPGHNFARMLTLLFFENFSQFLTVCQNVGRKATKLVFENF